MLDVGNDSREDYLINILRLSEGSTAVGTSALADYMGVSPGSVTEMLKVLKREGYVNYEKYRGVSLTESGYRIARDLRRKHHIMERFLTNVLDMDKDNAHEQAHIMEHAISNDAAERICRITGTNVDPDCSTCTDPCMDSVNPVTISISVVEMKTGDSGTISHLSTEDGSVVRKLISMGFVPGRDVELTSVVSEKGARIIRLGDATLALDRNMASAIFVDVR